MQVTPAKAKTPRTPTFLGREPTEEAVVLAEMPGWKLYERVTKSDDKGQWWALKLIATERQRKANYWFAYCWRSDYFLRGRDQGVLKEHHPEVHAWVVKTLREEAARYRETVDA